MRYLVLVFVGVVLAGCSSMPLFGDSLSDEVKLEADPGLLPQTVGEDHTLTVTVRDRDGALQQDARVLVDLGAGGTLVKLTDGQGQAVFLKVELKKVVGIKVEKTEKTRTAGT
jgi:hypothetical protein